MIRGTSEGPRFMVLVEGGGMEVAGRLRNSAPRPEWVPGSTFLKRYSFPGSATALSYNYASMAILDINEIREILPHRYPFLLVDRIVEMDAERVVGIKSVTHNEPFFQGHFPDFPVMPGVLIVEAMAQAAGVLVLKNVEDRHNKLVLLVAIENARFRRPVVPGDTLRLEMKVIKRKASVAKMAGVATVDGVVVAEAEVMCKLADIEEKPALAAAPVPAEPVVP